MANTPKKSPITSREEFFAQLEGALHHGCAPVALALTDLDGFAELNESLGWAAGDRVLEAWERVLNANLPADGSVVRLGGDEYVVVLPGMRAEDALLMMEEIRGHFGSRPVEEVSTPVAVSVGIAADPPHGPTAEDLWRAAGEALMRAKRDGRNRVALHVEEKMTLKSNYYTKGNLERLAKLSASSDRTEASLLREALDDLLFKYRERL